MTKMSTLRHTDERKFLYDKAKEKFNILPAELSATAVDRMLYLLLGMEDTNERD